MSEKLSVGKTNLEKKVNNIRVISSLALDSESIKKIEDFVAKKHSKNTKLIFEYETDISLLGGILIVDGDKYYDGTLKSQLIKIRKSFGKD